MESIRVYFAPPFRIKRGNVDDRDHGQYLCLCIGALKRNIIFAESFIETFYLSRHPSWCPVDSYFDTQGRPHVMLVMRHEMDQPEQELLRGEILAILAAIIARLETLYPEGHVYIPVRVHFPVHSIGPLFVWLLLKKILILDPGLLFYGKSQRKDSPGVLRWVQS